MNEVIGGEYKYSKLSSTLLGKVYINYAKLFNPQRIMLNRETLSGYQIIDQNEKKSMSSGLVRGAVGGALFGVVGAVAGASSAKNKKSYLIEVQFKDGKSSVIEMDREYFKKFVSEF